MSFCAEFILRLVGVRGDRSQICLFVLFCKFEFKFGANFKFELKFNAQILLASSPNPHRFGANRGLKNDQSIHWQKIKFTPNKSARKNQI